MKGGDFTLRGGDCMKGGDFTLKGGDCMKGGDLTLQLVMSSVVWKYVISTETKFYVHGSASL